MAEILEGIQGKSKMQLYTHHTMEEDSIGEIQHHSVRFQRAKTAMVNK